MSGIVHFLLAVLVFLVTMKSHRCSPILDMHMNRLKFKDGNLVVLQYLDVADNQRTVVHLNCKTPLADVYRWKLFSKIGSPYAAHMDLGTPTPKSVYEPWLVDLTKQQYPWELLVAVCETSVENDPLVTRVWIILKMKSSTSVPYHHTICSYDDAQCVANKFDCKADPTGVDYFGSMDRSEDGKICQPWKSFWPEYSDSWGWDNIHGAYHGSKEKSDLWSGHNFCRNPNPGRYQKPYCISPNKGAFKSGENYIYCNVPQCHLCMYGNGDGTFPGEKYNGFWIYPKLLVSNSRWTTIPTMRKGKKSYLKCHSGSTKMWNDNYCKDNPKVGKRSGGSGVKCLAVKDLKDGEKEKDLPDSEYTSRYEWVACKAPQCTVRQVWFLMVPSTLNNFRTGMFTRGNEESTTIRAISGGNTVVKFYHFGTNRCSGMTIQGHPSVHGFVASFKLMCRPSPQMSEVIIPSVVKEMGGDYEIKYVFEEGDDIIEAVEYKIKFTLIVKQPTSISLPKTVTMCPGYPAEVKLNVKGSFKVSGGSLDWDYSRDKKTWTDTAEHRDFVLSRDGLKLTINKLLHSVWIRVTGRSNSGPLEAKTEVKIAKSPYIDVPKTAFEGAEGKQLSLKVTCSGDATVTWIFEGQMLDTTTSNDFELILDSDHQSGRTHEQLIIKHLKDRLEGIYTVEVDEKGCKSTRAIHVSLIK